MQRRLSLIAAAAALCTVTTVLCGCASYLVVLGAATVVAAATDTPLPTTPPAISLGEIGRRTFSYPPPVVYAVMVESVERNGRKIVERSAESQSLRVSYPFSWLQNNWGGTLTITCAASEFGATVTIMGDGSDAMSRVRVIGDEVLEDLDSALRRQARTL